jgi:hypothetical protein
VTISSSRSRLRIIVCPKQKDTNFDIYYSGYIQTHCQQNKKIKRADQILPEVYGTTLNYIKQVQAPN